MPIYTIETSYQLPVYRHRNFDAATIEEACRQAVEDDDWENATRDYESAGETYVVAAWEGADAGYCGEPVRVPSQFDDLVQRMADHFGELVAVRLPARKMGLSQLEFEHWLPRALAAIAKADAILAREADPTDGEAQPGADETHPGEVP